MYHFLFRLLLVTTIFISSVYALPQQQVFRTVAPSVMTLYGLDQNTADPVVLGSTVAVTKKILATNCHVALSRNNLFIKLANDERMAGRIVYNDIDTDLCLVEIPDATFKSVALSDVAETAIGEKIYVIGSPNGVKKMISKGIVSNKFKTEDNDFVLKTEISITPAANGSGLFDSGATLIGITNSIYNRQGNLEFVIDSEWIAKAIAPMVKNSDQNSGEVTELEWIDTFGNDSVGLYYYNAQCYIHIYGFDEHDNIQSTALWTPRYPDRLLVFPNARSPNRTFDIFYNEIVKKRGRYRLMPVENYLTLPDLTYQFLGEFDPKGTVSFTVALLKQNLLSVLMNHDHFTVRVKNDNGKTEYKNIVFGLYGFKEALEVYNLECKQEPSIALQPDVVAVR